MVAYGCLTDAYEYMLLHMDAYGWYHYLLHTNRPWIGYNIRYYKHFIGLLYVLVPPSSTYSCTVLPQVFCLLWIDVFLFPILLFSPQTYVFTYIHGWYIFLKQQNGRGAKTMQSGCEITSWALVLTRLVTKTMSGHNLFTSYWVLGTRYQAQRAMWHTTYCTDCTCCTYCN